MPVLDAIPQHELMNDLANKAVVLRKVMGEVLVNLLVRVHEWTPERAATVIDDVRKPDYRATTPTLASVHAMVLKNDAHVTELETTVNKEIASLHEAFDSTRCYALIRWLDTKTADLKSRYV